MSYLSRGFAAFAWLVGEGCDAANSVFSADVADEGFVRAILDAVCVRGLPAPVGVEGTVNAEMSNRSG